MLRIKMMKKVFENELSDFHFVEKIDYSKKDQIAKVMYDAYKHSPDYENDTVESFMNEIDNLQKGLYGDLIDQACLCVKSNGNIIAGIFVCDFKGEATMTYCFTRPDFQGRGIAESLIKYAENELYKLSYKKFYLYLTLSNSEAFSLFDALGFIEINT